MNYSTVAAQTRILQFSWSCSRMWIKFLPSGLCWPVFHASKG